MAKSPGYVPITEVNEYSEVIQVGELGLPYGFDTERLELHVGRTERVARLSDLGSLSISGFRGDTTEYGYGAGGISDQGIATATRTAVITKADLKDVNIHYDELRVPYEYRWGSGQVRINNAEIEQRILANGNKWPHGVFDAQARGRFMNSALRSGLSEAAVLSQFGQDVPGRILKSMLYESVNVAAYNLFWFNDLKTSLLFSSLYNAVLQPLDHIHAKALHKDDLPKRQWSMFNRTHYDRHIAAQGLLRASRLIRSR